MSKRRIEIPQNVAAIRLEEPSCAQGMHWRVTCRDCGRAFNYTHRSDINRASNNRWREHVAETKHRRPTIAIVNDDEQTARHRENRAKQAPRRLDSMIVGIKTKLAKLVEEIRPLTMRRLFGVTPVKWTAEGLRLTPLSSGSFRS
jgi:hypothetical protein